MEFYIDVLDLFREQPGPQNQLRESRRWVSPPACSPTPALELTEALATLITAILTVLANLNASERREKGKSRRVPTDLGSSNLLIPRVSSASDGTGAATGAAPSGPVATTFLRGIGEKRVWGEAVRGEEEGRSY